MGTSWVRLALVAGISGACGGGESGNGIDAPGGDGSTIGDPEALDLLASVIVWRTNGGVTSRYFEMRGRNFASGREVVLGDGAYFSWSTDRSRFAVQRVYTGPLSIVSLADGATVDTTVVGRPRAWSADDRFLIVDTEVDTAVLLDVETQAVTMLGRVARYTAAGNLLVDDNRLCRGDGTDCKTIATCPRSIDDLSLACESSAAVVFSDLANVEHARWSVSGELRYRGDWSSGGRFATGRANALDTDVWIGGPQETPQTFAITGGAGQVFAWWAPDGQHVVFTISGRTIITDAAGGSRREYTTSGPLSVHWAASSDRLVIDEGDTTTVYALTVGDDVATVLHRQDTGLTQATSWSKSGSHVVFQMANSVKSCEFATRQCIDLGRGLPRWIGDRIVIESDEQVFSAVNPDGTDSVVLFEGAQVASLEGR